MLIDHNHPLYLKRRALSGDNKWNGAYYYSKEIVDNIIPLVKTDRNWITVNVPDHGYDHSIVFIHNNLYPELYSWLSAHEDLILVCVGSLRPAVRCHTLGCLSAFLCQWTWDMWNSSEVKRYMKRLLSEGGQRGKALPSRKGLISLRIFPGLRS